MRARVLLLLLLGGSAGADPAARLEREERELRRRHVRMLLEAAGWAERHALGAQAIRLWEEALAVAPDDARVRRLLGYRKGRRGWGADPVRRRELAEMRDRNPRSLPRLRRMEAEIRAFLLDAHLELGSRYLGDCPRRAREHLRRCLALDPDNPAARLALGYVRVKERWMLRVHVDAIARRPEVERALRESVSGPVAAEPVAVRPELHATGLALTGVKARFVTVFTTGGEERARALATAGTRALRLWLELFPVPEGEDPLLGRRFFFVDLASAEEYERVVDADPERDDAGKAFAKRLRGAQVFGYASAFWSASLAEAKDVVANQVARGVARLRGSRFDRRRPWLAESFALSATKLLLGTAGQVNVRHERTTAGGAKSTRAVSLDDFPGHAKRLVSAAKDPPWHAVLASPRNALDTDRSAKAWSVVDYLLFVRPVKGRRALASFMQGADPDPRARWKKAIDEAFGATPAEFESLWRQWTRDGY